MTDSKAKINDTYPKSTIALYVSKETRIEYSHGAVQIDCNYGDPSINAFLSLTIEEFKLANGALDLLLWSEER